MEQKMNKSNVYGVNGENQKQRTMVERIGGGITVIFSGMFILPILSVLTGAFGIIGIGLPAVAMMNLFGIIQCTVCSVDRISAGVGWLYRWFDLCGFIYCLRHPVEKVYGYCQTNDLKEVLLEK